MTGSRKAATYAQGQISRNMLHCCTVFKGILVYELFNAMSS